MNRKYHLAFMLLLIVHIALAQDTASFDKSKVSSKSELNFEKTDKRGIKDKSGIIYYVEKDLQTLSAYENGDIKWRTNIVFICGKPAEGEPEINNIKLDKSNLIVRFGKNSLAKINSENGSITYSGKE